MAMANEPTLNNNEPSKPSPKHRRAKGPHREEINRCSRDAKKTAAAVLEVMAGIRSPGDAAEALGISIVQYYKVELQALGGLLSACEPKHKGPRPSPEKEAERLKTEVRRLEREVSRHQTLARMAQRAIGLPESKPKKPEAGKRQPRTPSVRAMKVVEYLRNQSAETPVAATAT
jgi:hypothetical protein